MRSSIGTVSRLLVTAALLGGLLSTVAVRSAEAASNIQCSNQTLTGPVAGNVIVPQGKYCDLNSAQVAGNATVNQAGGLLADASSTINGYVYIARSGQFAAFNQSTVTGNVICQNCGVADLHNSTVNGSLLDNALTEGAFIQSSAIHGDLQIQYGRGGKTGFNISSNTIGGNLEFNYNVASSTISSNTIVGALDCNYNKPAPTGSGNVASTKSGQCTLI